MSKIGASILGKIDENNEKLDRQYQELKKEQCKFCSRKLESIKSLTSQTCIVCRGESIAPSQGDQRQQEIEDNHILRVKQ